MRLREIWREAFRAFDSGVSNGLISFVVFLLLAVSLGGIAIHEVVSVSAQSKLFKESGASVFRIDSPDKIDPIACDALVRVEGVDASGATRMGEDLRFALLPDLPTPYFEATSGMIDLLGVDPGIPESGLILEDELAASIGVTVPSGAYLANDGTPITVSGTFEHPDDGRDPVLNGAALGVSATPSAFDTCWVRFWPPTDGPLELLALTVTGAGAVSEATQWNSTLGRSMDPQGEFQSLPLSMLTGTGALVAGVLAFVTVRLRRLELASARHVGVSRTDLVAISLSETSIWMLPAASTALIALVFFATWHNPDPWFAAWSAGARAVVASAASWLFITGVSTATIRQTHLVRYFQQR